MDLLPGEFRAAGGSAGISAEYGGPGTIYVHKLPTDNRSVLFDGTSDNSAISHDVNVTLTNRTLFIDNRGKLPKDRNRNLTEAWENFSLGSTTAWVIPGPYPNFVPAIDSNLTSQPEVPIDYLRIYGGGQVAFMNTVCPTCNIDVRVGTIIGEDFIEE